MPQLAVFDLDKTLIFANSSFDFCRYLVAKKALPVYALNYSIFCYLRYKCCGLKLKDLHHAIFTHLLQGIPLATIEAHVAPFLEHYLSAHLYPPVFERLRLAQHLGHHTVILSNSPSFLVHRITAYLGVDESYATEYAVDAGLSLSHIASILQGEDKAQCVQAIASRLGIHKEQMTAYTDSVEDLPLLLCVGHPVVVNPDRHLKKISEHNKWMIL